MKYKMVSRMPLKGRLTDTQADVTRLTPRLKLMVEYQNDSPLQIRILTITGDVLLGENGSYRGFAPILPCLGIISISPQRRNRATLCLDLNYHMINIVEELRRGGDVKFILDTQVLYSQKEDGTEEVRQTNVRINSARGEEMLEIPQSKWVKFLQDMGYARFIVIELPIPEPPKGTAINKSLSHLREALKSFHEGDYDDVLVNCRKAIEQAHKKLTKQKLEGILQSPSKAEKIGSIQAKIKDFTSLGPHVDTKVDQRDAEMALHCTMSLIRYLARNLMKRRIST